MSQGITISGTAKTTNLTLTLSDFTLIAGIDVPTNWASASLISLDTSIDTAAQKFSLNCGIDAQIELPGIPGMKLSNGKFSLTATKKSTTGDSDTAGAGSPSTSDYDFDLAFSGDLFLPYEGDSYMLEVNGSFDDDGGSKSWSVTISSEQEIKVGAVIAFLLQKTDLKSLSFLSLALDIDIKSFSFSGTHTPATVGSASADTFKAKVDFDWHLDLGVADFDWHIQNASIAVAKETGKALTATASCTTTVPYINAKVGLSYDLTADGSTISMTWEDITATYISNTDTLSFKAVNWSVGQAIQSLIATLEGVEGFRLSAPWDLLDDIKIQELEVTYDFKNKQISLTVDLASGINLYFIDIYGFTLTRPGSTGDGGSDVMFKLNADLLIKDVNISVGNGSSSHSKNADKWNKLINTEPSSLGQSVQDMPSAPGKGNKYFDLEYLGMGQHIGLSKTDFASANTVGEVVKDLEKALKSPMASNGVLPSELQFDAKADWLFGTEMTLLDAITLGVVFNDPVLYGLLIEVTSGSGKGKGSGSKSKGAEVLKALSGLKFEILYKKITDSIGMYFIELKLPSEFRHLQFGEVDITLPVISLNIYTNGNFKIDIGYPASLTDWSNCLTIQAFPFTGSGGFYFADLSDATAKGLPVVKQGTFNPVIEFGVAANLGLGKSFQKGVLKAGISVVALGALQGTISWYHPGNGDEKSTYYKLLGTLGLLGKVYGDINFAIIQANVDLIITATATARLESYKSIPLTLYAEVEAEAEVSIELVFFTIHISFSFHTSITENMIIGQDTTAPWEATNDGLTDHLPQDGLPTLGDGFTQLLGSSIPAPNWTAFAAHSGTKNELQLYFTPHLSFDSASEPLYLAMLYINAPASPFTPGDTSSFQSLCNRLFLWVVNAMLTEEGTTGKTLSETGSVAVTKTDLKTYLKTLEDPTNLFDASDIVSFLNGEFQVLISQPGDFTKHTAHAHAAMFPMFPELTMTYQTSGGTVTTVDFDEYATANAGYFAELQDFVKNTATAYEKDLEHNDELSPPAHAGGKSVASYVFQDYFLMLAKGMLQNGIDNLESYQLSTGANASDSLHKISAMQNAISAENKVDPIALANSNSGLKLNEGISLALNTYTASAANTDMFERLCEVLGVNFAQFVEANLRVENFYPPQSKISYKVGLDKQSHKVNGEDLLTLITILEEKFLFLVKITPADLVKQNLLPPNVGTCYNVPSVLYQIKTGDSFTNLINNALANSGTDASPATYQGASTIVDIMKAFWNANLNTQNVFKAGALFPTGGTSQGPHADYIVKEGDSLQDIIELYLVFSVDELASQYPEVFQTLFESTSLTPNVSLVVPGMQYKTGASDTLSSIAAHYHLTVADLAHTNLHLGNFWAKDQMINIPGLQALTAATIATDVAGSKKIAHLAGLGSRIFMSGLRLPDSENLTVNGPVSPLSTPIDSTDGYSLYHLTGQQIPANANSSDTMTISLDLTGTSYQQSLKIPAPAPPHESLLERARKSFSHSSGDDTESTNTVSFTQTSRDVSDIVALEGKIAGLTDELSKSATLSSPVKAVDVHFPLGNSTRWKYPGENLISGVDHPNYKLFKLSEHTVDFLEKNESTAKLKLFSTNHDIPTKDGENPSEITDLFWCTRLKVELKELPNVSMNAGACYELLGVDHKGLKLLDHVITAVSSNPAIIKGFSLLYRPIAQSKSPGGYESASKSDQQVSIVQADLSKFSSQIKSTDATSDKGVTSGPGVENSTVDFLSLLAQASIENKGGYYLYFNDLATGKGIPANVFNQKTIGEVELIINYGEISNPPLYVNALVANAPAISKDTSYALHPDPVEQKDTLAIPEGNYHFELERKNPTLDPTIKAEPHTLQLLQNYSLLSFQIEGNDNYIASESGLVKSPKSKDKASTDWYYEHSLPLYKFSTQTIPGGLTIANISNGDNPYLGIGKEATVNFNWVDLFGNLLTTPCPPALNITPTYFDELTGLDRLPGLSINYLISVGKLTLNFEFNRKKYITTSSNPITQLEYKRQAQHDLHTYTQSWYQVQDLFVNYQSEDRFWVYTSLNTTNDTQYNPVEADLVGLYTPIIAFLQKAAQGTATVSHPKKPLSPPSWNCGTVSITNDSPVFELEVSLGMTRNSEWMNPHVHLNRGDYSSWIMQVKPDTAPATKGDHSSLKNFATLFEQSYNIPNDSAPGVSPAAWYKIAIGESNSAEKGKNATRLWVVQFGKSGIRLNIDSSAPDYYAVAPLANSIVSLKDVAITKYDPTTAYSHKSLHNSFSSISLDKWGRTLIEMIDKMLLPEYAIPASIIGENVASGTDNAYEQLLYAKKQIAEALTGSLQPIYQRTSSGVSSQSSEQFKEKLLERLSNVYDIETVIETKIKKASVTNSQYVRVEGKPVFSAASDTPDLHNYSLSNAKVNIQGEIPEHTGINAVGTTSTVLTTMLSHKGSEVNSHLTLDDLEFQITHLEHQIGHEGAFSDRKVGNWLSFVHHVSSTDLNEVVGMNVAFPSSIVVPMILRSYPTPPSILGQTAINTPLDNPLAFHHLLEWNYELTYSVSAAEQDSIIVDTNALVPGNAAATTPSTFETTLASFISNYDWIASKLPNALKKVDYGTLATGTDFKTAFKALKAFATLVSNVAAAWPTIAASAATANPDALIESQETIPAIGAGTEHHRLNIATWGDDVTVLIPDSPYNKPKSVNGKPNTYDFKSKSSGEYLSYHDRNEYPQRTLSINNLSLLNKQSAQDGLSILRNQDLTGTATPATTGTFLYQTPVVRQKNALVPFIRRASTYDLATFMIFTAGATTAPLSSYFSFIISQFFGTVSTLTDVALRFQVDYRYRHSQYSQEDIILPIAITTLDNYSKPTTGHTNDSLDGLATYVNNWVWNNGLKTDSTASISESQHYIGKVNIKLEMYKSFTDPKLIASLEHLFILVENIKWIAPAT